MNKDSIVWVGSGTLGCLIPKGRFDDPAIHNGEQVVQDLRMQLEAWFMKTICTIKQSKFCLLISSSKVATPCSSLIAWLHDTECGAG